MGAIKEHGGLTLSQAEFDHHAKSGMPQSAASGGVVEDEMLIATLIEDFLQDLGYVVGGPAGMVDAALKLANEEALDAAILDVTIHDQYVYPVAERLLARGIPFMLCSGYGEWSLPESLRNKPRLTKPFLQKDLEEQVRMLVAGAAGRTPAASARRPDPV